jgi:hypothetical protein
MLSWPGVFDFVRCRIQWPGEGDTVRGAIEQSFRRFHASVAPSGLPDVLLKFFSRLRILGTPWTNRRTVRDNTLFVRLVSAV